jgi:hypothetical protein
MSWTNVQQNFAPKAIKKASWIALCETPCHISAGNDLANRREFATNDDGGTIIERFLISLVQDKMAAIFLSVAADPPKIFLSRCLSGLAILANC